MTRSLIASRSLLALCAFAVVQFVASVVYAHIIDGYVGFQTVPFASFVQRVIEVDRASPAYRDGLRRNDRIDLRAMSVSDRVDMDDYLKVGRHYRLPIVRAGKRMTVTINMDQNIAVDPGWQGIRGQFYFGFCGIMAMFVVAAFLLVRRPESPDVALLSASVILIGLGENFSHIGAWATMSAILTQGGRAISPFLLDAGLALLATYSLRFAWPPSRLRRGLVVATYAVAAIAAAFAAADPIGYYLGTIDDSFGFFSTVQYGFLTTVAPAIMPLLCALLALRDARGEERLRVAWATGSLAMLYIAPIAFFAANAANVDWPIVAAIHNFSFPLAAAGLAYALLGHRLLDVGFALNRAAVFAAVSLVVIGTFSLAEWALGGWLASASRSTNVTVSALLALGLGLAIHPIHTWTDRFIDRVFFRKRHEAEHALRTFAKEVTFITDRALVLERTIAILRARTDCTSAEIFLYDGASFGDIDENDPALVTLRASREVVPLRGVTTQLHGEFCFPMAAGGRLLGALVVGPKRLGESFAPDERDAIAALAHGVGVALALLSASTAPAESSHPLPIETLVAAIEALPDALAAKLRGERAYAE
jgi:hypothetical protein